MAFKQFNCPSCGAPLELKYRFSQTVVCEFCGQASHLSGENLSAKGEKVKLSDYGTKFYTGAFGTLFDTTFKVHGRVRYEYPDGFWDEWVLTLDNKPDTVFWLQEDEGDYTLFEEIEKVSLPSNFDKFAVGETFKIGQMDVFISEKNTAQIVGGEGELPHRITAGERADFVDGIVVKEGLQTSIEFLSDNQNALFVGLRPVKLHDFIFTEKTNEYGS